MTNVVTQIMHPMIEEMQVVHEREMAELRSQMQDQIEKLEGERDELQEKADDAYSAFSEQDSIVYGIKKVFEQIKKGDVEKGIAPRSITLDDLVKNFSAPTLRSGEKDYDVLSELEKVLAMVEPVVEYKYETIEKIVYRTNTELPTGFKDDLSSLIEAVERLAKY